MQIDKETIESREFETERKGYKKSEVDEFLTDIANQLEESKNQFMQMEGEIQDLRRRLDEYDEIDKQIRDSIIFLKDSEKEAIIKTKNEVAKIIKEAESKKDKIIDDAEREAKSTRDTLLFLKEQQEILIKRMKILINNQESMLIEFSSGDDSAHLQKSIAEAAAYRSQVEMNVDEILEKLL